MLRERFSIDDIDEEVVSYGVVGFLLIHRLIERTVERRGVSFGELMVLMHLRGRKEEIILNHVKQNLIVFSGASITKIVEKLVAGGLITRRVNPASRREKLIKATPAGKRMIAKLVKELKTLIKSVTKGFTVGEKRRLIRDMRSILGNALEVDKGG